MTNLLRVTPEEVRASSRDVADISTEMKDVVSSLVDTLGGEGAPWGHDQAGAAFANGPSGYLAQLERVRTAIGAKTDFLDAHAEDLQVVAADFEQADRP